MRNGIDGNLSRWVLISLFAGAAFAISLSGYLVYQRQAQTIRNERFNDLRAISQMKCSEIVSWRNERINDALIYSTGLVRSSFINWMGSPNDPVLRSEVIRRLSQIRQIRDYQNMMLVSLDGQLLFSIDTQMTGLEPWTKDLVVRSVFERKTIFGEFFRCPICNDIHMDIIAPIMDNARRPFAAIILRTNPEKNLYPIIQSWPLPSRTAETLLGRRDNDSVVYLNTLRHRSDPPLSFRIPIAHTNLPVVQAILGKTGRYEGPDYRGVRVLANLQPIPGSSWFMVAKVDTDEILAEAYFRGAVLFVLVLIGILMTGGVTVLYFSYQQRAIYQRLYEAERERWKGQEEIRATLYGIGDGVIAMDREGKVRRMNPLAEKLTGWTETESLGIPLNRVFHIINEKTRAEIENPFEGVLRTGMVVDLVNHTLLISRDGREIPIADSGAPIRDTEGNITGVVLIFRDQTEERASRNALRESENRYRSILNDMIEGCQIIGYDWRYIYINDAAEKQNRRPKEELLGNMYTDMWPGIENYQIYTVIKECIEEKKINNFANYFMLPHGDSRWFELKVQPVAEGVLILSADITERKIAEEKIAYERILLRTIIDNLPFSIYAKDTDCRKILANSVDMMTMNKPEEEVIGYTDMEIFPREVAERTMADDLSVIRDGKSILGREEMIVNHSGEQRWLLSSKIPLRDQQEKIIGLVGIGYDITDRKLAEDEKEKLQKRLLQSQKLEAIGTLAGGIAHDFNNILSAIIGYSELAIFETSEGSQLRSDIEKILEAANRAKGVVNQILTFSRQREEVKNPLNIAPIVKEVMKLLRASLPSTISIKTNIKTEIGNVISDPTWIHQLMMNLCTNAALAMQKTGGTLSVTLDEIVCDSMFACATPHMVPGRYIQLVVSDTGHGMSPEVLERIFEPYYTTKDLGEGSGLGLSIVHGIVDSIKGTIHVYSEIGKGSTFKVYLPVTEKEMAPQPGISHQVRMGKGRILFVDDEPSVVNVGSRILKRLGYDVVAMTSSVDALDYFRENHSGIDLVISDLTMPSIPGDELARMILELRSDMPVIICTGYSDRLTEEEAKAMGIRHYLGKPLMISEIAEKVYDILSNKMNEHGQQNTI